jgi:hypothetical protein
LKVFPFSLGGEAKAWSNSLAPKSITNKEGCIYLFCKNIFLLVKYMLRLKKLFTSLKVKKKVFRKLGGDLVPSRRSV